jgi:hypothetical protein
MEFQTLLETEFLVMGFMDADVLTDMIMETDMDVELGLVTIVNSTDLQMAMEKVVKDITNEPSSHR